MAYESRTVLEFRNVVWKSASYEAEDVPRLSFRLAAGEIMTVLLDRYGRYVPFCALAAGLLPPDEGEVRFLDGAWSGLTNAEQAERRGEIGRVFEGCAWVSNLTVLDNVLLAQRHHTKRPDDEIRAEAEALASAAGIAPLPELLADRVAAPDLKRAEWVRAFLGQPRLVLLEKPEQGLPDGAMGCLFDFINAAARKGTAVVWLGISREATRDKRLTIAKGFSIEGGRWTEHPGGGG